MNQELQDFNYFEQKQLIYVNFQTGQIDSADQGKKRIWYDVGSKNHDGYIRMWCNGRLRMRYRLIYFLYHHHLPTAGEEIDHFNSIRDHDYISNLRILSKSKNNSNCTQKKYKQFSVETIQFICKVLSTTTLSDLDIAHEASTSRGTIRDIKTRRTHKNISKYFTWLHRNY